MNRPWRPRGEWRYSSTLSLTSTLDGVGGECHTLGTLHLGRRPSIHCIGGRVGPRAGLDWCRKSHPTPGFDPRPSSPQRVTIPTELPRPTVHNDTTQYDRCTPVAMRQPHQTASETLSSVNWSLSSVYPYSRWDMDPSIWTWAKRAVRWMVSPRITTLTKRLKK